MMPFHEPFGRFDHFLNLFYFPAYLHDGIVGLLVSVIQAFFEFRPVPLHALEVDDPLVAVVPFDDGIGIFIRPRGVMPLG